jgi:multicomponent Na+:H+ antiporter subunit E
VSGFVLRLILLSGVWLLTIGELSWGDSLIALIVSASLLLLLGYRPTGQPASIMISRILAFWPFLLIALREIVVATWNVAVIVLGFRLAEPGYVEVPVGERTPVGIVVTSWLTTLIPGSVLIDIEPERNVMIFHVFDASDPRAFVASLEHIYDRYQRRVFP